MSHHTRRQTWLTISIKNQEAHTLARKAFKAGRALLFNHQIKKTEDRRSKPEKSHVRHNSEMRRSKKEEHERTE